MVYWLRAAPRNIAPQEHIDVVLRGSRGAQPDAGILAELYEQYYDRVARYIASRTGNRDVAEDMAGDVFLRAVESFGSFQHRGVPVQAWLFRIAHNLIVDHYRRGSRRHTIPIDETFDIAGASDVQAEVEHRLTMERVYQAMQHLNAGQQEVISLRFMAGLSAEDAGTVMGRTSGAIRELQRTAIKALRSRLGPVAAQLGFAAPEGAGETP